MGKIDLSLLKNTNKIYAIKDVQNNVQKDEINITNTQKDENKLIKPENNSNFPTFNEVMNQVNKNINNSSLKDIHKKEFENNDIKNDVIKKDDTVLTEIERNKLIAC